MTKWLWCKRQQVLTSAKMEEAVRAHFFLKKKQKGEADFASDYTGHITRFNLP
jgi:hypothetical protein